MFRPFLAGQCFLYQLRISVRPFPMRSALPSPSTTSGSDFLRIIGSSSFGRAHLPVTVVNPSSSAFRLRPTWVWVSPCVGSLTVCRAFFRFGSRLNSVTRRISQVPDASLHACHALKWTPADPRGPHQCGPSVWASGTVNTVAICVKRLDGAVSSFGVRGLSCGLHVSLCTLQRTCSAFGLRSCRCNTR